MARGRFCCKYIFLRVRSLRRDEQDDTIKGKNKKKKRGRERVEVWRADKETTNPVGCVPESSEVTLGWLAWLLLLAAVGTSTRLHSTLPSSPILLALSHLLPLALFLSENITASSYLYIYIYCILYSSYPRRDIWTKRPQRETRTRPFF
ncbi:hypothetical protein BC939DRAFT_453823 [Gamsiella multidivaricata]|uniref:uncharacterized protein n=1 Tax=Gamsiella multidivaricata TaxID=101098 RepID=UPI00221FB448|nr:uncharacterized protein BC939DRAFT_453823 [Gamsiella multidivaricata]KAI7822324.1 hypothetical protein BC939DRAFT_453823 [Gamsiella multidivaricata]